MAHLYTGPRSIRRVACFVFLIGLALLSHEALAQTPAQDAFNAMGFQKNHNYFSPEPYEHYDTVSGNVLLTFTDLTLPGNAGRSLQFQRTFNNQRIGGQPSRWSFGLAGMVMHVVEAIPIAVGFNFNDDAQNITSVSPLFVMADNGRHPTMPVLQPNSSSQAQIDFTTRTVMSGELHKYDRQTHTMYMADGTVAHYAANGLDAVTQRPMFSLVGFEDLYGNSVSLTWSPEALTIVQDLGNEQVRQVALTRVAGRVESMTFDNKVWHYTYENEEIVSVTLPIGGLGWTFDYDGDLKKITTPNGGRIEYVWENVLVEPVPGDMTQNFERHFLHLRRSKDRNDVLLGTWTLTWGNQFDDPFSFGAMIELPSGAIVGFGNAPLTNTPGRLFTGGFGLSQRLTLNDAGQLVESESLGFVAVPVIRYSSSLWWGTPELSQRTLTRGTRSYSTQWNYDTSVASSASFPWNNHNPTTIVENNNEGLGRTTTRTYTNFLIAPGAETLVPYVLGLPTSEQVTMSTDTFQRTWDYGNPMFPGFVTQSTGFARPNATGIVRTFAPDARGNVATESTATSSTSYLYSWGAVSQIATDAHTTSRVINIDGTLASETKAGRTTAFQYDELGRQKVVTPAGGTTPTLTDYDPNGATITTTRGNSSLITYLDSFGRPTGTQNSLGVRANTGYDAEGRVNYRGLPFYVGGADVGTTITYDALDRITSETHADNTHRDYAYSADTTTIADEEGRTTVQRFVAFGHPDDARLTIVTDAKQQAWGYAYDVLGRIRNVAAPDSTSRTWEYNDQSLLFRETHPESGVTTYQYNAGGLLAQKTDAKGQTFVYTYDGNDRLKTITAGSEVTSFTYEPGSDNRASATVGATSNTFTYDAGGRPSTRTVTVDGYRFTTTYGYDANDNLTSIWYPSLGTSGDRRRVGYDFDAEHRLSRVFDQLVTRDFATNFDYHASGALLAYRAGNNVQSTFTYDPNRHWMTSLNIGGLWSLQYLNYDGVGNVRSITDSRAGMNQSLAYDELDRLMSVTGSSYPSNSYTYDIHGNRASASGVPYTYGPTLRLESQNGESYTYDNNGNLWTAPNRTFTYTPRNMMATATVFGATSTYAYDADDWRVKKQTGTTTTYYLRGLNGELLTEWTNPGPSGTTKDYVYAGSRLITGITRTWTESSDFLGEIIPNGPTVTVSLETPPGRDAKLRFDGVAGQYVSAKGVLTNGSMSCLWGLKVLKPDGTALPSPNGSYTWGCSYLFLQPILLPESGSYTLMLDQGSGNGTGTADLNLYMFTHLTGTIIPSGPSVTPNIIWPGQEVHYSFDGTQGERVSAYIEIQGNYNCGYHLWINKPDGTPLTPLTYSTWGCSYELLEPVTLPSTGVYTLVVDPMIDGTGTATLTLYGDVIDQTGTITLNGASETATISTPGRQAVFTFTGTPGQRVSAYGLVTSGSFGCGGFLGIRKPDGTVMTTPNNGYCGSMFMEPVTLPDPGTYQLIVDPALNQTGVAVINAYDVPPDATGSLTVNGAAMPVSITAPGQQAKLTFAGTTGQQVTVSFSGNTITMAGGAPMFVILRPDGYWQTYWWYGDSSFSFPQQTLGQTGTYTVVIDPQMMNMGNISVQVTSP